MRGYILEKIIKTKLRDLTKDGDTKRQIDKPKKISPSIFPRSNNI